MARTYAGILALVGMLVVLLRALKNGAGFDGSITQALIALVSLAGVGLFLGLIGERTVDESVRKQLYTELDTHSGNNRAPTNN